MNPATITGRSLLAGSFGKANGDPFNAVDPFTDAALQPEFFEASLDEVDIAVQSASAAFEDYRSRPPETKARLLEEIAAGIEALGDALIQRAHSETGLPVARLQGERARTCAQLRLFAGLVRDGSWVDARIDRALPDRKPAPRPDLRRMLVPLGPVLVFGSSNFPLAFSVAGGDSASAFAAGCPVIVKAHRAHPGTAELVGGAVARAVSTCGLPTGLFSLVHGGGPSIGIAMVKHSSIAAVAFTGSHVAGRALFDAAAARPRPIPVFAEMSSVNPVFVLPEAMRERGVEIASALTASVALGVGQFCTKPGLVFVLPGADTDTFLSALEAAVESVPSATMLTRGIQSTFTTNEAKVVGVRGVSQLAVGKAGPESACTQGRLLAASTTGETFLRHAVLTTEAFGPFTLVIVCKSIEEMTECARSLDGQLTATIHANNPDIALAKPLVSHLEQLAGRLVFNGFPTGVEVSPAMNHGGPYPATSDSRFTSVGTAAILRFARPVCYQGYPEALLPPQLINANPMGLLRLVNGAPTRDAIAG